MAAAVQVACANMQQAKEPMGEYKLKVDEAIDRVQNCKLNAFDEKLLKNYSWKGLCWIKA